MVLENEVPLISTFGKTKGKKKEKIYEKRTFPRLLHYERDKYRINYKWGKKLNLWRGQKERERERGGGVNKVMQCQGKSIPS